MHASDWRDVPGEIMTDLYAREHARWLADLHWNAASSWEIIEAARLEGRLPGYVVWDRAGTPAGWTFFVIRDGLLQLGAVAARRADVVRCLVDAVLGSPEASLVRRYQAFVYPQSPAVEVALTRRRFDIDRYLYLERPLAASHLTDPGAGLRPWREEDLPDAVRLMARAYAGSPGARCFAPGGRLDEWTSYLGQLVRTPACGRFAPGESFVAAGPGAVDACLVGTRLDDRTAHVAQVVVDPARQRQGLASQLLASSARAAVQGGAVRQTLLVAESNASARALYGRLGFVPRAVFLFADRTRITRQVLHRSVDPRPTDRVAV
jgi:ribosomal protein S18 acetylase RimI-like enzyme